MKRALLKEGVINVTCLFKSLAGKTSHDFSSNALFSCHELWFAQVRSVVNNISKSALHRSVCIIATPFRNKTLTNSNKFIHIVTRRHNTSKSIKGSIDADGYLVFNETLSQNNGSMGWGPGPAKGGQNFQNMPSL